MNSATQPINPKPRDYSQEDCAARFVDISFLKRWPKAWSASKS